MAPKKKNQYEEDLVERIEAIENALKNNKEKIAKIKSDYTEKITEIKNDYTDKIEKLKNEYTEEIKKIKENYVMENSKQTNNEYIQKNEILHNTEISRPVFYGNHKDQHPKDFLNRLEEYFAIKRTYIGEKIIVIGDCLKASAYNWFSTIRFQLGNYEDFKRVFMEEYWSRDIQIQVWSQCLSTTQVPHNISYREHFSNWANKLRHLEMPRLSEAEIVKNIAAHYPGYLRAILISMQERTILNAMRILGEEEHRRAPDNHEENRNNYHYQNNNTYHANDDRNLNNNQYQNKKNNSRWNSRNNNTQQPNHREVNQPPQPQQQINQMVTEDTDVEGVAHAINNLPANNLSISPYLQCEIEGEKMNLLVDTGATVSVLTKEIIDLIVKKNNKIPILPVSGVRISNAVGKKICNITRQVYCECVIGDVRIFANFIQIENLNEKGIIGADILTQYNTKINFHDKTIQWKIDEIEHVTPFARKTPRQIPAEEQLRNLENVEEINDLGDSNETENIIFSRLIEKYQHIFSNKPGRINKYTCQIKISPGETICQRPYPIPISKMERFQAEIDRMMTLGIIERSTSPWSSPIVGIEKKNGDLRVCIDARKINQRIIPDCERPMNIEDILIKFKGSKYLSSIDLTAGYWQCTLNKNCREVTAFLFKGRNYQFQVLPFGLVNSVAEFQKIIDKVLGPEILQYIAIYVDDIHIMSNTFDEHMYHLETIFKKLSEHNITINREKSHFLRNKITFLGHVISPEGISMDPEKIETIQNFQPPQNKKQIQVFLGFINFYRRYIRDLSQHTSVLSQLIKKGNDWTWGETQQQAFEEIKRSFLKDIIMEYPDFNSGFFLSTDASRTHIGAELFQLTKEGRHRTLGFISRTLNAAEQNYHTTELELLAIVFGCQKFRNYIIGHSVTVLTDHQALTFLNSCKLLNARLTRWSIILQEYGLKVQHIPGKENIGADTLTRYPQKPEDNDIRKYIDIYLNKLLLTKYSTELKDNLRQIGDLQRKDPKLSKILEQVKSKPNKYFMIHEDKLFSIERDNRIRLMIPTVIAERLIIETHEHCGHVGTYKTYSVLKNDYHITNMYREIKKRIKACDLCQKSKATNQQTRGPLLSQLPAAPHHVVSLDLMGPMPRGQLGARYILALLDIFSKHVKLYPIKRATTDIILNKVINDYLPSFGPIRKILTDNGTQFQNIRWKQQLSQINVETHYTTPYHPEGNPVERTNREIGRILRTYCHAKHSNWVKWLPTIEHWLNNTTHTSTGYTPQQILTGKNYILPIKQLTSFPNTAAEYPNDLIIELARQNMQKKATQRNQRKDQGKRFPKYTEGQWILVREHKLSSAEDKQIRKLFLLYRGPYKICRVNEHNTVTIEENGKGKTTYNIKNIKPYITPERDKLQGSNSF
uniref:RNA-directed DNA polymerase n=1 Tax=Schizaphis graminum TaxID=13262 RepID=A0A2S2NEK6_SCHGA